MQKNSIFQFTFAVFNKKTLSLRIIPFQDLPTKRVRIGSERTIITYIIIVMLKVRF